jgi:glycosyltransferase involved in cell wall biosynthesis
VVAYYFPPVGGVAVNRTLHLVRGLCEAGWQPLVLTVDDAAWMRDPARLAEVPPRARVLRLANPDWGRVAAHAGAATSSGWGRGRGRLRRWLVPDLHVGWSLLATPVAALLAAIRAVDVVYTTAPPYSAHFVGAAARALGVPWIADFRDGWTCCPTRADLPPLRVALERRLEDAVLRRADRVIFASPAVEQRCVERVAGLAARSETLLTGFDPCSFAPFRELAPPRERFEMVHAGNVFAFRRVATLERFLAALRAWARSDPSVPGSVRVRLLGAEPAAREPVAAAGLADWVHVEPAVPRARLGEALARAHLCLALAPPGERGGEPVPGKLFDAAGAGRPLLAVTGEGPPAALIRRLGLGAVVAPEDERGLVSLLRGARARAAAGHSALPFDPAGARSLDATLTRARLVALCDDVARRGAAPRGGAHRDGAARREPSCGPGEVPCRAA